MPSTLITPEKAFDRLQRLCARSEISSGEARRKLFHWGMSTAEAETIIDRLVATRFIDDDRFARVFAGEKVRYSYWGERKIMAALRAKGVDGEKIRNAIDAIDPEELEAGLIHILKSRTAIKPELLTTYEGRARLYAFAVNRGFSSSAVSAVIRRLANDSKKC